MEHQEGICAAGCFSNNDYISFKPVTVFHHVEAVWYLDTFTTLHFYVSVKTFLLKKYFVIIILLFIRLILYKNIQLVQILYVQLYFESALLLHGANVSPESSICSWLVLVELHYV